MPKRTLEWATGEEGIVDQVEYLPSLNQDGRSGGADISLVVLHYISVPAGRFGGGNIEKLFTNALGSDESKELQALSQLRVSAHFLIDRSGRLVQFVPCARRAWHAGLSSWKGVDGCNDFSIGIEIEGTADAPFEPVQLEVVSSLLRLLASRYPIKDVVGHEHIAPGRKSDPGAGLPWGRFS